MAPREFALAFAALLLRAEIIDEDGFRRLTEEICAIPLGEAMEAIYRRTVEDLRS